MTLDELSILAEHHTTIPISAGADYCIGAAVAVWEIKGMKGIESLIPQGPSQGARQLGIQQNFHAASSSTR
jgi:hypothetical protein